MKHAAIFDLDGVIVDSSEYHLRAWQSLGDSIGRPIDEKFFKKTFGMTNKAILTLLLEREPDSSELSELALRKEEHYRDSIRGNITALPGVVSLIQQLAATGWGIGLGTSAPPANVKLILSQLGIASSFGALSMEGDYERGKPAPDVFLYAAKKLGVSPVQCVVFEDAVVGVAAAKAGGMKAVAVTTTSQRAELYEADLILDSLDEVTPEGLMRLFD